MSGVNRMEDVKIEKEDQAKELRALLNELNKHSEEDTATPLDSDIPLKEDSNMFKHEGETSQMNVLNLPPRSTVHGYDKRKVHFKISKPLLRLLSVITVLVLILGAYIFMVVQ